MPLNKFVKFWQNTVGTGKCYVLKISWLWTAVAELVIVINRCTLTLVLTPLASFRYHTLLAIVNVHAINVDEYRKQHSCTKFERRLPNV